MSLTDREVVERERICITNVECANHTKCKSGQGLGGSHLKSCNNDGALEIELAEIFIFICFAFCLHTDAAWRKQHVTFLCTSWTVLFVCVKTFKSSRGIRTLSKLYLHVIGTLIRCSPPHFSMPQLQNYITARELVQIGSGWLLCTFACRMRWLSLGQDKREDKNQEIIRLVCLSVCAHVKAIYNSAATDWPWYWRDWYYKFWGTLWKTTQTQQIHTNAHLCNICIVCEGTLPDSCAYIIYLYSILILALAAYSV